ncbi:MAG: 6-carboxytetrahydropterin synthase QueD [Ruminococcus sp.]|nr:6-carboxytetrahydropterin synthase QueD [Ruminococcus sp.]
MYSLKTRAAFDSAHFLAGYNGKCANIHGHRWELEVCVSSGTLQQTGEKRGMVIDFGDLKHAVRALADSFDHALIFESGSLRDNTLAALREEGFRMIEVDFRPTAENFARHFHETLTAQGLPVTTVTVWETPENCAVYEEESNA